MANSAQEIIFRKSTELTKSRFVKIRIDFVYDFIGNRRAFMVDEYTFENDKDINERIGERVSQLRESHHISQEEMAEIIGRTTRMYQNYEKGRSPFPDSAKVKIAEKFSVTMDELYFGDEGEFEFIFERHIDKYSDSRLGLIGRLVANEVDRRLISRSDKD